MPGRVEESEEYENLPVPDFTLTEASKVGTWLKKSRAFMEENKHIRKKLLLNLIIKCTIDVAEVRRAIRPLTFTKFETH